MRNRFFIDNGHADRIELEGDEFHHARVLRCRVGEEVELFDSGGRLFAAVVTSLERDRAILEVRKELPSRESPLAIDLAIALIPPDRFELVLQKGCELGVRRFIPLVTDRTETRAERVAGKRERWEKILFEAAKQSGRSVVPAVAPTTSLADALREGTLFFFDADAPPTSLPATTAQATILIGPEGGWSPAEIDAAGAAGASVCRLGPRRLRAETAAIAAVVMIAGKYGDLG